MRIKMPVSKQKSFGFNLKTLVQFEMPYEPIIYCKCSDLHL
jgi:hypothetical protein